MTPTDWRDELWKFGGAFDAVTAELHRAITKHSFERTPFNPDLSDLTKLSVLMEEVGETAAELTYDKGTDPQKLKAELLQVAAMAIAWWVSHNPR